MTTSLFPADAFLIWHEWSRTIALALLCLIFAYALIRFVAAGSTSAAAGLINGRSLRADLLAGLLLVGTVPAVSLGVLLAERSAHLRHERLANRLEETALAVAAEVDQFMDKHVAGVATAASAVSVAGRRDTESLTRWLLLYHEIYADFLTMLSADEDGDIMAATSNMAGFLAPVTALTGHNVRDRAYFQQPLANGETFVSQVFQGRDLGRDPIVAVSAAVRDETGKRVGIVEGSLNLRTFVRLDKDRLAADGATLVLLDQDSRVIYAGARAGYTELQSIAADPMIVGAPPAAHGKAFDYIGDGEARAERFLAATASTANGWTVYLRAPLAPIAQQMLGDYGTGAALLMLAVVLSLLLAGGLLRRLSRTVNDLNAAIDKLKLDGVKRDVAIPRNTPLEFMPMFVHMRKRSTQLRRALARLANSIKAGEKLRRELVQSISSKDTEIAEQTAELEAANARLSQLSRSDALTGIANRRAFESFVARIWRHAVRDRTEVAVIMIDIDHFKPFNDSLGHQAGDTCLRAVANALQQCATRPLDLVSRYGGEEFVAVLGGANEANARVVAERMRQAVFDLQVAHPESIHGVVTISAGVAASRPTLSDDVDNLVRAADEALYRGKTGGRNCVFCASDDNTLAEDSGNSATVVELNRSQRR